jgi:hypothetical protein
LISRASVWVLGLAMAWPVAQATQGHRAHVHGVARMMLSMEGTQLQAELELPLDTLLGFERAPRTPAERDAAAAALARLRDTVNVLRITPEKSCEVIEAQVQAPVLEGKAAPRDGHADALLSLRYTCSPTAAPQRLEVLLFQPFKRLDRIDVQMVLPQGQGKAVLRRTAPTVNLQPSR